MRILLTSLLLLVSSTVYALQTLRQIPVVCMHEIDFALTMETFGEMPLIRGKSVRLSDGSNSVEPLVVFFNTVSKTWTIGERVSNEVICVVAVGENLEPMNKNGTSIEEKQQGKKVY